MHKATYASAFKKSAVKNVICCRSVENVKQSKQQILSVAWMTPREEATLHQICTNNHENVSAVLA